MLRSKLRKLNSRRIHKIFLAVVVGAFLIWLSMYFNYDRRFDNTESAAWGTTSICSLYDANDMRLNQLQLYFNVMEQTVYMKIRVDGINAGNFTFAITLPYSVDRLIYKNSDNLFFNNTKSSSLVWAKINAPERGWVRQYELSFTVNQKITSATLGYHKLFIPFNGEVSNDTLDLMHAILKEPEFGLRDYQLGVTLILPQAIRIDASSHLLKPQLYYWPTLFENGTFPYENGQALTTGFINPEDITVQYLDYGEQQYYQNAQFYSGVLVSFGLSVIVALFMEWVLAKK